MSGVPAGVDLATRIPDARSQPAAFSVSAVPMPCSWATGSTTSM
jgi:hypothetical protein